MSENSKQANGIIHQMDTLTRSFSVMKGITYCSVICMALCAIVGFFLYSSKVSEVSSKVYVLDNGTAFSASVQDASITKEDEVRDHVLRFHELMLNIPPNTDMIKRNLERAMDMADRSAYKYYNDLQEKGFYKRLISTSSYQQMDIKNEDIQVDLSTHPYKVMVKGTQYVVRDSNISQYTFISTCTVTNAVRSSNNLHGLMINDFCVIENNLVETRIR